MKKIVKERPINKPFRYFNHTLVTKEYQPECCAKVCFFREKCNEDNELYHRICNSSEKTFM